MFRGTFTALVTPFRDGGIDVSALEDLIEEQMAAGITGIVAIGTTGPRGVEPGGTLLACGWEVDVQ